jgi:hypothetical protein
MIELSETRLNPDRPALMPDAIQYWTSISLTRELPDRPDRAIKFTTPRYVRKDDLSEEQFFAELDRMHAALVEHLHAQVKVSGSFAAFLEKFTK